MAKKSHRDTVMQVLESAVANLQKHKEEINDLNVFPVPDGDTGSNMMATLTSAWNNIKDESQTDIEIFEDFSQGALLGARGNSGVILSQIIKGMSEGIKKVGTFAFEKEKLKVIFEEAKVYAYKSVANPVEGTILSVTKAVANDFGLDETKDLESSLLCVLKIAQKATEETPEQLPILKESGVVDSGAYGLVKFIEGAILATQGKSLKINTSTEKSTSKKVIQKADPTKNIGYCTEFVLTLKDPSTFDKDNTKKELLEMGDSLVYIVEGDILKVHIHSKTPGSVFTYAQQFGEFSSIKSDNMAMQAENEGHDVSGGNFSVNKSQNEDTLGIIAVSNGTGLIEHMTKLGANHIVSGGQSMNPSVEDFMNIIKEMPNKKIVLLPNNSNIILTAETVKANTKDKEIFVLPTKTLSQGIVALENLNPEMTDFETFEPVIIESFTSISEGQITKAVRDTNMNNVEVKKNDFISISGKVIVASEKEFQPTFEALTKYILEAKDDIGLLTIIYNENVSSDDQIKIRKFLASEYPDLELEIMYGGQDVYHTIVYGEE